MNKRSSSNLTRLKKQPLNETQIKAVWNGNKRGGQEQTQPVRKLRTFNHSNSGMQGKIVIDKHTIVEYDYSKEMPVTNIKKMDQPSQKDTFIIPKYPVLKGIVNDIPKKMEGKEMEMYIVKDMNQVVLWKNNEFQYYT